MYHKNLSIDEADLYLKHRFNKTKNNIEEGLNRQKRKESLKLTGHSMTAVSREEEIYKPRWSGNGHNIGKPMPAL